MKRRSIRQLVFGSAAIMFVMVFAACATAPEADVSQPEPIKEEKAQKPAVVTETVYLASEEQSWFADGVADERRVNRYDETTTNKLESLLYDAEQKLQERTIYEWKDGLLLSERTENGAGEVTSTHRYAYDNSLLVEDRLFDQNDELQTRLHWDYDAEGRKTRWEVYNGSGALLAYTLFHYEGGRLSSTENYNPAGGLEELFESEYENGLLVKRSQYDKDKKLESYTSYRYENALLVEEIEHRKNGTVIRKTLYRNNEEGMPVEITYLDASDNVLERITKTYIARSVTRTVGEE